MSQEVTEAAISLDVIEVSVKVYEFCAQKEESTAWKLLLTASLPLSKCLPSAVTNRCKHAIRVVKYLDSWSSYLGLFDCLRLLCWRQPAIISTPANDNITCEQF